MKKLKTAAAAATLILSAALIAPAFAEVSPEDMKRGAEIMKQNQDMMKPELLEKVRALPPETKKFLTGAMSKHERLSKTLTLRQAMQDIPSDYQAVGAAIAVDNGARAAYSARRIANHTLPKGGILPYLPLDKINGEVLSVLPTMEVLVEGGAAKLAAAAEQGDMATAARLYGDLTVGCVTCHAHFRGQPGVSPLLK